MPENTSAALWPTCVTRWKSTCTRWLNCWTLCWARWSPSLKRAVLALRSICRLAIVAILRVPPLPSRKARELRSPRLFERPNELPPDTGASLHRSGTFAAQQVVRRQQLPLLDVLAKGRRPVVNDVGRVPGQCFHHVVVAPAPALQRQLEFPPRHTPKDAQRDVVLPAQPLVLIVGQTLPLGGRYASPSSLSPPVSSSSASLGLISPAASKPSKILSM